MIREEVMIWVGLGLLVLMAFVLIPAYEGFKNAEGKEVDVDPNAPASPDWLKPLDEGTGKPADSADIAKMSYTLDNIYPGVTPSSSSTSSTTPSSTSTSTTTPASTSTSSSSSTPPPSTQSSDKPSGVTTLPSQSMPPTPGDPISLPDSNTQVLDMTLPSPNYGSYGPGGGGVHGGDKYILKTSLQPCACPMGGPGKGGRGGSGKVPGEMDNWPPTGDDAIKRPSGFQNDGNEPVGYLNSFNSFMK